MYRASSGFSRRINSVQPTGSTGDFAAKERHARAWFAERDLPLIFRVTPLCASIDPLLDSQGYAREAVTDVMVATAEAAGPSGGVRIAPTPSSEWRRVQVAWMGVERVAAWEGILGRMAETGHAAFASVSDGEALVAAGIGVRDGDATGLFEVTVAPERRREGFGRALSQGLMAWGKSAGSRRWYLQVEQGNLAARTLYDSLGFVTSYTYWYRRAPVAGREAPGRL